MPKVLVTGAGRGIGRAVVTHLAGSGWDVLAGVRSDADGDALRGDRITPVLLDVTDAEQIAALPEAVGGRLDAVVNNAGVVVAGPVEALDPAELRRQLDINVVGQQAVTRAVLPAIRDAKGRVVFISSISGRLSSPFMGAYSASKFALEGLVDALRVEVRPWGIKVILVEPGSIDTDLWRNAESTVDELSAGLTPEHRELYGKQIATMRKVTGQIAKRAASTETVVAAVEKALTASRPRARYLVGMDARAQLVMGTVTPTRVLDAAMGRMTGGR
jgi:NAD(P)-dependent dehydrogenase (short-subunit alcohol dehydrogenase family)